MYSLVTKVTCFTAWQNGDKRKKNAVLLPVKYFVPPWKGAKSSRNVEVALSPWIANELFFFNRIICSHNYHFRLEKKKKKGAKTPQMLVPCLADVYGQHQSDQSITGVETVLSRRIRLACSQFPEGNVLCQAVLFGNMMAVSATLNLSFPLLPSALGLGAKISLEPLLLVDSFSFI